MGTTRLEAQSSGMFETNTIIADSVRGNPDIGVVATTKENGTTCILLWNYHDVAKDFDEESKINLSISELPENANLSAATITIIDEHNANAYTVWRAMGEPQDPTSEQIATLHAAAQLKPNSITFNTAERNRINKELTLRRQSVALIEIPVN